MPIIKCIYNNAHWTITWIWFASYVSHVIVSELAPIQCFTAEVFQIKKPILYFVLFCNSTRGPIVNAWGHCDTRWGRRCHKVPMPLGLTSLEVLAFLVHRTMRQWNSTEMLPESIIFFLFMTADVFVWFLFLFIPMRSNFFAYVNSVRVTAWTLRWWGRAAWLYQAFLPSAWGPCLYQVCSQVLCWNSLYCL